jgi:hypothetical protein
MTSFVAWVAVDNRAPSSVYFASDSRLSTDTWQWDFGRKLFASQTYPDILGYVGDAFFPSQILGQIIDLIDLGVLFNSKDDVEQKLDKIKFFLYQVAGKYPFLSGVCIYYCSRFDKGGTPSLRSTFRMYRLWWRDNQWQSERIGIPTRKSGAITIDGSGKIEIESAINIWKQSPHKDTSRSIFSAFCDALEKGGDLRSGGAPQLAGIHRKGNGKYFGIVNHKKRFFLGLPVHNLESPNKLNWFNDIFEVTDGATKKRQPDAQKHLDLSSG